MQLLPTANHIGISTSQGLSLVRRWMVDCCTEDLYEKIRLVCNSHYPGHSNCVPVSVAVGPPDDKVKFRGIVKDGGDHDGDTVCQIPDDKISDYLEIWDKAIITCQYQYLGINEVWPTIERPTHPKGTVLNGQVRGSGEILQITPLGFAANAGGGFVGDVSFNSRIVVPNAQYHISCDRMTDEDVCNAMHAMHWRYREGTVNWDIFLGEPVGTLLFDSWTLDPTFAPDIDDCRRWRLSCVLRCRQIAGYGPYPNDINNNKDTHYPIGWNHDYKVQNLVDEVTNKPAKETRLGWWFVMLSLPPGTISDGQDETPYGNCPGPTETYSKAQLVPRYPYSTFGTMFCSCDCLPALADWCTVEGGDPCSGGAGDSEEASTSIGGMAIRQAGIQPPTIEEIYAASQGVSRRTHARHQQQGIQVLADGRWSNESGEPR